MSQMPGCTAVVQEAERWVIGVVLTWPERAEELEVAASEFFLPQCRYAMEAIESIRSRGEEHEIATVARELERQGKSHAVDLSWLAGCAADVPTADNLEHYTGIVREAALTRRTALALSEATEAHRKGLSGSELLTDALERLSGIDSEQPDESARIGQLVRERFAELKDMADRKARGDAVLTGIPTGIQALDELVGGLQLGIATVVAGRPGMGKSAVGMALTDAITDSGNGVHVFSLEDTRSAYVDRAIGRQAQVSPERIRQLELQPGDLQSISGAMKHLDQREGWLVDDRSGITADEIVRSVRRARRRNGTRVVIVDYIQLVRGRYGMDTRERLNDAMETFAAAAKKDGMAYVVFSQLNRNCESRDDKRPQVRDLNESDRIGQIAKCVLLLYRPGEYFDEADGDLLEIIVGKNNQGQTGTVEANWHGPTMRVW